MREVIYTDRRGWRHRALVRDSDPDDAAPGGVSQDPPDLWNGVDWEGVARDLHNQLVQHRIMTWKDLQRSRILVSAIQSAVKRRVIECFKYAEMEE